MNYTLIHFFPNSHTGSDSVQLGATHRTLIGIRAIVTQLDRLT